MVVETVQNMCIIHITKKTDMIHSLTLHPLLLVDKLKFRA